MRYTVILLSDPYSRKQNIFSIIHEAHSYQKESLYFPRRVK